MSATLVSSNTTIKVNAAVSVNTTHSAVNQANGTYTNIYYTAPANGYADLTINLARSIDNGVGIGNGRARIEIGGLIVADTGTVSASTIRYYGNDAGTQNAANSNLLPLRVQLGPGQSITSILVVNGASRSLNTRLEMFGVEYINTP